jgi:glycosyltransferase involved in cell wall biosynthesis
MKFLHRGNAIGWDDEENEPYRRMYGRPAGEYMQGYADFDIALAPLKANKFSRCKSQLKLIEAGFFKLPLICSATEPYTIDGKHGHNCLMVQESKGHKDWYRCMKMLLKDDTLRRELGENLHKDVQKYHIREQIGARIDLYKHLY